MNNSTAYMEHWNLKKVNKSNFDSGLLLGLYSKRSKDGGIQRRNFCWWKGGWVLREKNFICLKNVVNLNLVQCNYNFAITYLKTWIAMRADKVLNAASHESPRFRLKWEYMGPCRRRATVIGEKVSGFCFGGDLERF